MISLSGKLYQRCRGTFLRCSEFDDDDRLRAAFIVDDLAPFRNGLPNSRRKTERIELCIAYLVEKQFIENKFLLAVFILALRDHYIDETELWDDLNDLYQAVNNEVGEKCQESIKKSFSQDENRIGELIEAPVELTKEHEHDQPTTDRSPIKIPTRRQKEGKTKKSLAKKKDFFISYNRNDKDWAVWIAWQLEAAGYTTVIQAWDFRPGSNFVEAMNDAAKNAERTIAVLSPDYVASKFTAPEWNNAFARDPTGEKGLLLPVKVRNFELDGLLRQIVCVFGSKVASESGAQTATAVPKSTSTAVSTPSKTPTVMELSPEIKTVDQYYKYINNAGNKDDLQRAWEFLTTKYRCNLYKNCKSTEYRDWWWIRKVHYKLCDCGSTAIEAELTYYYRDPEREITPVPPTYVKYWLVNDGGYLKIDSGKIIEKPDCVEVISSK